MIKQMDKKRGFELVKDSQGKLPVRATKGSAGYDFYASERVVIKPFRQKQRATLIKTGVKAYMQKDECLKLYARSSMPLKLGIFMSNGVGLVDSDYYNNEKNEGEIMFEYTNLTGEYVVIEKGSRIGQGVFEKYLLADNDEVISEVRSGGLGSTGVK